MKLPVLIAILAPCPLASGIGFDDLTFYGGAGSQRSGLVLDWGGGSSLAWGYRHNGASGLDMLASTVRSDPRLYAKYATFSFGTAIIGIGYDFDGDGFAISDGTDFGSDGWVEAPVSDGATAVDVDDLYLEGWDTGYWSYWLAEGDPLDDWTESSVGLGSRLLTDTSWDGLSFAPGFVGLPPSEPMAAPEPATLLALAAALLAAQAARRRTMPK